MKKVKELLKKWLFAEEMDELANRRDIYYAKLKELQGEADKVSIVDLARKQLGGYDAKLLDSNGDLPEILGEIEKQEEFLGKAKALKDNPALEIIVNHLIRKQIMYSVTTAPTLDEINFGRATVNGISLFREEVDLLATVFEERHAKKEKFDEFNVT